VPLIYATEGKSLLWCVSPEYEPASEPLHISPPHFYTPTHKKTCHQAHVARVSRCRVRQCDTGQDPGYVPLIYATEGKSLLWYYLSLSLSTFEAICFCGEISGGRVGPNPYKGTSLIRNRRPPRTTIGP